MSGGGGGGGNSTTVQSIPEELKPLATAYAEKAMALADQAYVPYTGQRYADLNGYQNAGIGMTMDRAMYGDRTINAGENYLNSLLTSDSPYATQNPYGSVTAYSNPYANQGNPYLDAMVNKAQQNVMGNAVGASTRSGSFGNTGIAEATARQMGDIATQMYGNAWDIQSQLAEANTNRNQQAAQFNAQLGNDWATRNDAMYNNAMNSRMNAAQLGLNYGNQMYTDANNALRVGQLMQDNAQQNYDFGYQQFQDEQNLPYKNLAAMSGVFGSNLGSTSTTTQSGGGGK